MTPMSVIMKQSLSLCRLLPDQIEAIADYMHLDGRRAAEFAADLLDRPDGVDLIGWLLQDYVQKARWRCDEREAARRQELYQRFLDSSLHGKRFDVLA